MSQNSHKIEKFYHLMMKKVKKGLENRYFDKVYEVEGIRLLVGDYLGHKQVDGNEDCEVLDFFYNGVVVREEAALNALLKTLETNKTVTSIYFESYRNNLLTSNLERLLYVLNVNNVIKDINLENEEFVEQEIPTMCKIFNLNKLEQVCLHGTWWGQRGGQLWFFCEALKSNKTVRTIDLSAQSVNSGDFDQISNMIKLNSSITSLNLSDIVWTENDGKLIFDALMVNKTLTEINLSRHPNVGQRCEMKVNRFLKLNNTMRTLVLSGHLFKPEDVRQITEGLKLNNTLVKIGLANCGFLVSMEKDFADVIKTNKTLTSLDLSENFFRALDLKNIADALILNKTLQEIHLCQNGSVGEDFGKVLDTNNTLTSLYLSRNKILPGAFQTIARALRTKNQTLKYLSLAGSIHFGVSVTVQGAIMLIDALKTTTSVLHSLNLNYNCLGLTVAVQLGNLLVENKSLKQLKLDGNAFEDKGIEHICFGLKGNDTLQSITLVHNLMGRSGEDSIRQAILTTKTLKNLAISSEYHDNSIELHAAFKRNPFVSGSYSLKYVIGRTPQQFSEPQTG